MEFIKDRDLSWETVLNFGISWHDSNKCIFLQWRAGSFKYWFARGRSYINKHRKSESLQKKLNHCEVKPYFVERDETHVPLNWIQDPCDPPLPFCPLPYHQLLLIPTEKKHSTWPSYLRIPSPFSGDWLLNILTIDH